MSDLCKMNSNYKIIKLTLRNSILQRNYTILITGFYRNSFRCYHEKTK